MNDFCKRGAWVLLAALCAVGCSEPQTDPSKRTRQVYTTFYPTTYFAQRIAGSTVRIVCPLPDGADPIFWTPPPKTITDYQNADLVIVNGAGFEKWLAKVSLQTAKLVDTTAPLAEKLLTFNQALTHSHGPEGEHSHEGLDGHTWLDPRNAQVQAEQIRQALARLLPDRATEFQANADALAVDLRRLDRQLREVTRAIGDGALLASHPADNYLAAGYKWKIVNLDLDPRTMPGDEVFKALRQKLKERPAKVLLWESEPKKEIADRFSTELGLTNVVFSPCETLDAESQAIGKDYLSVMIANIARLARALAK